MNAHAQAPEDVVDDSVLVVCTEPDLATVAGKAQKLALVDDAKARALATGKPPPRTLRIDLGGEPLDFPLDADDVAELVEFSYRLSGGWRDVDLMYDSVYGLAATLIEHRGQAFVWDERKQQRVPVFVPPLTPEDQALYDDLGQARDLLDAAQIRLSAKVATALVEVEALATEEVKRRIFLTHDLLMRELARYAPTSIYSALDDAKTRGSVTPRQLVEQLARSPWQPEPASQGFVELRDTLLQLAAARDNIGRLQAEAQRDVRDKQVAELIARCAPIVAELLRRLATPGGGAGAAAELVRLLQELARGIEPSPLPPATTRLVPPPPPLDVLETLRRAREAISAATAAYAAAQTTAEHEFPLLKRVDIGDRTGAREDDAALIAELKDATTSTASRLADTLDEVPQKPVTAPLAKVKRPDVAAGRLSGIDVFTFAPAVRTTLDRAGYESDELAYIGATVAIITRGAGTETDEVFALTGGTLGFLGMYPGGFGVATQLGCAVLETADAIRKIAAFPAMRRAYLATLDPSLELIETEPSVWDLAGELGEAALEWFFFLLEVAALE